MNVGGGGVLVTVIHHTKLLSVQRSLRLDLK